MKTVVYDRTEYTSAFEKLEAKGKCQLCEQNKPFVDEYGVPYLGSHHIIWWRGYSWKLCGVMYYLLKEDV